MYWASFDEKIEHTKGSLGISNIREPKNIQAILDLGIKYSETENIIARNIKNFSAVILFSLFFSIKLMIYPNSPAKTTLDIIMLVKNTIPTMLKKMLFFLILQCKNCKKYIIIEVNNISRNTQNGLFNETSPRIKTSIGDINTWKILYSPEYAFCIKGFIINVLVSIV